MVITLQFKCWLVFVSPEKLFLQPPTARKYSIKAEASKTTFICCWEMGICGSLWHTYQRQVMSEDIGQQNNYPLATSSKGCWLTLAGWVVKDRLGEWTSSSLLW